MSVLFFANGLSGVSGLDKSLINTANELCRRNYDVKIISLFGNDGGFALASPRFDLHPSVDLYALKAMCVDQGKQLLDKQYTEFTVSQPFLSGTFSRHDCSVLRALNKILGEKDTVFFTHPVQALLFQTAIGKEKRRVKTILQIHGNYKEDPFCSGQLFNSRRVIDYLQIVAPSMHEALQEISGKPGSAIKYIPNIHRPIADLERVPSEHFRVSLIGSLQPRKNQMDGLRIAEFFPKDSKVVLSLWGGGENGDYGQHLRALIAHCGLSDRVHIAGIGTEAEIYSQTDLVLATSEHEGFSYIFFESASYGIPVVSYNCEYGPADFIEDGKNGFLIPLGDTRLAAQRILECAKNAELCLTLGKNAQEKFCKDFAIDDIVSFYKKIIGSTVGNTTDMKNFYRDGRDPVLYDTLRYERGYFRTIKEELFENQYCVSCEKEKNDHHNSEVSQKVSFQLKDEFVVKRILYCTQEGKKISIPFVCDAGKISFITPQWNVIRTPYIITLEMTDGSLSCLALGTKRIQPPLAEYSRGDMSCNEQFSTFTIDDKQTKYEDGTSWRVYGRFEPIRSIEDEIGRRLPVKTRTILQGNRLSPYFNYDDEFDSLLVTYNSGKQTILIPPKISYEQIYTTLQKVESECSLYEYKVGNVFVWPIIKAEVIENLCCIFGLWGNHFRDKRPVKNLYRGLKNINEIPDCDRLIFEFPRKSQNFDLVTRPLHDGNYILLEYPQESGYSIANYTDGPTYPIVKFLDHARKYKLPDKEAYNSHFFKKIFLRYFGVEIDFTAMINARLHKFKSEYTFWGAIFSSRKIQEIVVPSAYWSSGILSAAHANNIQTADLQYAIISPKNPTRLACNNNPYHADKLYCWSRYWQELAETYKQYSVISRLFVDKEEVDFFNFCIISQPRLEKRLLGFLEMFAKSFPKKKIAYAAHPAQSKVRLRKDPRTAALPNVFIPDQETVNVIRNSEIILGVYSTSLFEAAYFGKPVYIIPIPGYEIVTFGIKQGIFRMFTPFENLHPFQQPAIAQSIF